VPLKLSLPIAREWTLVVDAPGARACLAAWELPTENEVADHQRRFEVMWSFEPEVVRAASEVAAELLWKLSPEIASRLPDLGRDVTFGADELRFADALSQRIVGYLGALVGD
jgi:DICT domain-containing protein